MKWIPHALVVAVATGAPAFFTFMANHPLTWETFAQAVMAFLTTTVAVYLQSPRAS